MIAVWALAIVSLLLVVWIGILLRQIRSINRQLEKRMLKNTRAPISLDLISRDLNRLTENINKTLKAEETLRLEGVREEKRFREMITNISHDLRTPLTAVKGYQQLMEKGELTENQKLKLAMAQKNCEELGRLIDHFYEYSYLLNGESDLHIERINVTNMTVESLAESIQSFEEKGLYIRMEKSDSVFILGDRESVKRILQNLIRNCVAHSAGEIRVQVRKTESAVVSFQNPVKLNTKIDIHRLFDRFYVGDTARGKTTGLGLSIVKLLAEQMNGYATAFLQNSMLDIQIYLPLAGEESAEEKE
jgi:signal transduction histidine kinase